MTRIEENKENRKEIIRRMNSRHFGSHEEKLAFELSMVVMMLSDISKSLAIIADNVGSEK
jgi:hypothetical protein